MSWKARLSDTQFRPPGRPRPPRGIQLPQLAGDEAAACPVGPPGRGAGASAAAAAAGPSSTTAVRKRASTGSVASGGPGAVAPSRRSAPPAVGGPGTSRTAVTKPTRPKGVAAAAGGATVSRPRAAGRVASGAAVPLTSVAVQRKSKKNTNVLTAVSVSAPPPAGSPPRARQVIIPPGTINETVQTVLDLPSAGGQRPQRVLIPPGSIHEEETVMITVPPPAQLSPLSEYRRQQQLRERAKAAAELEALEAERERVQRAKLAFAQYLAGREDPEVRDLRSTLLSDIEPCTGAAAISEEEAFRAQDVWELSLPDIPELDDSTCSRGVPGSPPGQIISLGTSPIQLPFGDFPNLDDIDPPPEFEEDDIIDDVEEAPAALNFPFPPPPEPSSPRAMLNFSFLEPLEAQSPPPPPRITYRHAPRNADDLMWEWASPPRPTRPVVQPPVAQQEPYSAELFRLIRFC